MPSMNDYAWSPKEAGARLLEIAARLARDGKPEAAILLADEYMNWGDCEPIAFRDALRRAGVSAKEVDAEVERCSK
jgi:hypothetical protein